MEGGFMKKLLFLVVCCLILVGCGNNDVNNEKDVNQDTMSTEQISEKIMEIYNWLTTVWNTGISEISWYIGTGTNSVGETMDIDFVIQLLKEHYQKKNEYVDFINSLNDDYSLLKTSFTKAIEQADIIIEKVNLTTPQPNTKTDYQENID